MIAGIIAAGDGSRLRSEGIDVPKPLVRVDGVPLIERLLRLFARHGITRAVCLVNADSLSVKEFIDRGSFGLPVDVHVRTTPSSMHSLFALAPHLERGAGGEKFLLSTVDPVFSEADFANFLAAVRGAQNADGVLAVTRFIDDENPLYVGLDDERRITSFGAPSPWVTGGLYAFSASIFRETAAAERAGVSRLRNFLAHLLAAGCRLEGFPFPKIVDVDHVSDIRTAEEFLRLG